MGQSNIKSVESCSQLNGAQKVLKLNKDVFLMEEAALGSGTFASVHRAYHPSTKSFYAIKAIDKAKVADAEEKANTKMNIMKEVALLEKVGDHKHIVKMSMYKDEPKYLYVVMDMINGTDLHHYVVSRGHLREIEARKFFTQLLDAVSYCHSINVAHRDLKLENIMVTNEGEIKLIDFGLGDEMKPGKKFTDFPGSAPYASPQLVCGHPYEGSSADVWALGIILYGMVLGEHPFWNEQQGKMFRNIVFEQPSFNNKISRSVTDLLAKMLEKNPAKRITIAEIKEHAWMKANPQSPLCESPSKFKKQIKKQLSTKNPLQRTLFASQVGPTNAPQTPTKTPQSPSSKTPQSPQRKVQSPTKNIASPIRTARDILAH